MTWLYGCWKDDERLIDILVIYNVLLRVEKQRTPNTICFIDIDNWIEAIHWSYSMLFSCCTLHKITLQFHKIFIWSNFLARKSRNRPCVLELTSLNIYILVYTLYYTILLKASWKSYYRWTDSCISVLIQSNVLIANQRIRWAQYLFDMCNCAYDKLII